MRWTRPALAIGLLLMIIVVGCSAPSSETVEPPGDGLHSTVPDVVGMAVSDAAQTLEDAGYASPVLTGAPSDEPSGTVVGQDPIAGTSLAREGVVELTFSTGP